MKGCLFTAALAFVFIPPTLGVAQNISNNQIAARTELYPIPTLTLSDEEFLRGDGGKPVTVGGALRIAQGSGRLPVVMMIHGSFGLGAGVDVWSNEFLAMGVSTFVLDGFTGRGLTSVNTDQALLGRLNMIVDAYRALEILSRHPRVDPTRIALMGFSRGGQATLYAGLKRFNRLWNRSGIEFAAYLPFYPDCMTTYVADTEITGHPVHIFHGASDDYNPIAPCKGYIERVKNAGNTIELTEYQNAPHVFDNPFGGLTPTAVKGGQTVRHCAIREEPAGKLINSVTKEPWTYKDPCVEFNPHTGYNPVAAQAATQSVKELIRTVFKLN